MSSFSCNGPLGADLLTGKHHPKCVVSSAVLNALPAPFFKGELPAIKLTNSMYNNGLSQWKFSLIGRLDLHKIKLEDARPQLLKQWNVEGEVKIIPIGRGFFVIKLDNEKAKSKIWAGESWKVANQDLQVRDWEPRFNPENQRTSLAKVWIKFPGLSLEYWTEENLLTMAKAFGKPIQVDNNTLTMDYGFFASVLVEVDFANKIPDRVWVGNCDDDTDEGFWQSIELHKVPKFCSHCKIVGHLVSECRSIKKDVTYKAADTSVPNEIIKKKRRRTNKAKETLSLEESQEGIMMSSHIIVQHDIEEASLSSTDPSIPPGFETLNRFEELNEEKEVVSSQMEVEVNTSHVETQDPPISFNKPSSSEPILSSIRNLSSKAKASGMFPKGTFTSSDPNKISVTGLKDMGSVLGFGFPSSKKDCQGMFGDFAKHHVGLTFEYEESPS